MIKYILKNRKIIFLEAKTPVTHILDPYFIMYNDYTQGARWVSLYKFPSREYSFRSVIILARTRERILTSLPLDLTFKQSGAMLGPLSPAKKRRECFPVLSATFWATVCTYLRFPRRANPFTRTYCRRNGSPDRKTSSFNGDGSDWPCAQINSRLDICTWRWCCVIVWSRTLLSGLLPLA